MSTAPSPSVLGRLIGLFRTGGPSSTQPTSRSSTPALHRERCERAITTLDHASNALQRHAGTLDATIDTAAARLILSEAIATVAAELRLRVVALESIRQAGFAALAARHTLPKQPGAPE